MKYKEAAGQLRLANTAVHAQGTDLALTGRVDLAESAIDARLALIGPELAGAPDGTRPELGIVLKGPIEAPRRTLDVTAFVSWLALRAGHLDEALPHLRAAVRLDPQLAGAWYLLGQAARRAGRRDEARQAFTAFQQCSARTADAGG